MTDSSAFNDPTPLPEPPGPPAPLESAPDEPPALPAPLAPGEFWAQEPPELPDLWAPKPPASQEPPTQPLPRRRRIWPIAVLVGLVLAFLFSLGVLIFGWSAFQNMTSGQREARAQLDQFLKLLSQHKEDEAYSMFSAHAQKTTSLQDLQRENNGSGFDLVDGYQHIEIRSFEIERGEAGREDAPQGEYADVHGWILYDGKPSRPFNAILEHEGASWRLYGISITSQPDSSM